MEFTERDKQIILNRLRMNRKYFTLYDVKGFGVYASEENLIAFREFLQSTMMSIGYTITSYNEAYGGMFGVDLISKHSDA